MQVSWFRIQVDRSCACLDLHGISDTETWMMSEDRQPLKKEWEKETLERWAINLVSGLARFAQMLRNSCRHYPVSLTGHSENLHSTARATLLLEEIASWRYTTNFPQQVVATIAAKKNWNVKMAFISRLIHHMFASRFCHSSGYSNLRWSITP